MLILSCNSSAIAFVTLCSCPPLKDLRPCYSPKVVTGFLGSGKTTLVNHILKEDHGLKIAVVENEYGQPPLLGAWCCSP